MAVGLGAHVTIIDRSLDRLRQLDDIYSSTIVTLARTNTRFAIVEACRSRCGSRSDSWRLRPKLVRRDMLPTMKKGSVIVDVAIDQGGCVETAHATSTPIPSTSSTVYCIIACRNAAAVPHTSTFALNNATFPYLMELANRGLKGAVEKSNAIREGVNTFEGHRYPAVAKARTSRGKPWRPSSNSRP